MTGQNGPELITDSAIIGNCTQNGMRRIAFAYAAGFDLDGIAI